jgi:hypothetical protein
VLPIFFVCKILLLVQSMHRRDHSLGAIWCDSFGDWAPTIDTAALQLGCPQHARESNKSDFVMSR